MSKSALRNLLLIMISAFLTIIAVSMLIYFSFIYSPIQRNAEFSKAITDVISADENYIEFKDYTNFDWDTLYFFGPYEKTAVRLQKDGIVNPNSLKKAEYATYTETDLLLVFCCGNKVLQYAVVPRISFGGDSVLPAEKLTPEQAMFEVRDRKLYLK